MNSAAKIQNKKINCSMYYNLSYVIYVIFRKN
jgi:hypothetical protein